MTTILCATRGGEASIRTQQRAIAMAKEREAELLFLYVTDVKFLSRMSAAIVVDVAAELDRMGEFLLLMAKERAEKEQVAVDTVVKRGDFRVALVEAAQERGASIIVLGSPAEGSITQRAFLEELVANIQDETGIEVVIV
jgi:nucleotide-binding universal stress UspA family protein